MLFDQLQYRLAVAPPGFCNRGKVRYGYIGGLEYEVPQSRLYVLCINVALCSTALQCICSVIRRSSMTMKAHTYYIIFGRPPIAGEASPLAAPLQTCAEFIRVNTWVEVYRKQRLVTILHYFKNNK